LLANLIHCKG
jgi:hypothetical protein